jgi:hypothetical protein
MMRASTPVTAAMLTAALTVSPLTAQSDARLDVLLPTRASGGSEGPAFSPRSILATSELRELLRAGFPARLHFRCELWRADRFNNQRDAALEWDMLVRYDQLNRTFDVFRVVGGRATRLGRFDSVQETETFIERPFRITAPPMVKGKNYYYDSSLDIEVLSLSDLDEVERWLRGEVRPALSGERNPGTALTRTVRGLFAKLLGSERRHYQTRTPTFRAE